MDKGAACPTQGDPILSRVVNVLSIIYAHVYFPTYSNSLKDIGRYLGCRWTATEASGLQSIVWRRQWETTGAATFKDTLTTYNMEDCLALRTVTECLYAICPSPPARTMPARMPWQDLRCRGWRRSSPRRADGSGAARILPPRLRLHQQLCLFRLPA